MKYLKKALPFLVMFVITFIILQSILFQSGYPVRGDNSVHLQRSYLLKDNLIVNKQLTGWNYLDNLGSPFLTHTYILSYLLIVLLNFLSIPIITAYKILIFISFILPSLILHLFLSKKFNKNAAFIVSTLFLISFSNIQEILEGAWNQYFAIIFLLLFFYFLDKYTHKLTLKKVSILSILLSLVILSHTYVGLSALILFSLYFIFITKRKLFSTLVPVLSFLMTSFYIIPLLITNYWTVKGVGWGISQTLIGSFYTAIGLLFSLQWIQNFNINNIIVNLPVIFLDVLAILGLTLFLKKSEKNILKISFLFLVIMTIIGTGFWFNVDFLKNLSLENIISFRFITIAKIPLFIFAAFALSKFKITKNFLIVFSVLIIVFSIFYISPSYNRVETSNSPELADYFNTINYMRNNLDLEDTRIILQNPYHTIESGTYTPINLATTDLKIPVIGIWSDPLFPISESLNTHSNLLFNKSIKEITSEEIAGKMRLYNAKYIVSITPELSNKLENKEFKKIKSFNNFKIFSIENSNTTFIETSAEYKILEWPNPIKIEINSNKPTSILIKMAYHPFWKAFVNNKEIEVLNEDNLIKLNLPEGKQILTLNYESNKLIYIIISLLALISATYAIYFRIR